MAFISSTFTFLSLIIFLGIIWKEADSKTIRNEREIDDNFQLICNVTFEAGNVPVLKYRSLNTGMHVYIAQIDGPIVKGVFTIPTEAQDDDGLPHTLEHLVFKGSQKYPYASTLDLFSNWNNAEGTNAYTAKDHTAYMLNTAGKDGFLNILPVYLDHILHPLLTNESFITEVHHITKKGEDAGVVYSEMQGRENTRSSLMYDALLGILYPPPCGYRYNTGGLMKNLRESTTNEKIRNYHKRFYQPEFLHVTITGKIEPTEVFDVLNSVEAENVREVKENDSETRPWSSKIGPFGTSEDREVIYPSQSEETGSVMFAWRGPDAEDILEIQSIQVLMRYLTDLTISPLTKAFTEDRELSNSVYGYVNMFHSSSIVVQISGVSKENLAEVKPHFLLTLKNVSSHPEFFDDGLMETLFKSLIVGQENALEKYSHSALTSYINKDILFGKNCDFLDKALNVKKHYEEMRKRESSFWLDLLNKYLIDTPMATVVGIPSKNESKRIKEKTKARLAKRKVELGEQKFNEFGEIVEKAKKKNDIPLPPNVLNSTPIPSTENLPYHNLTQYTNLENHESGIIPNKIPQIVDLKSIPFKLSIDDIKSKAVQITAIIDHSDLTSSENYYIPLLMKLLLSSPILKNCELISAEDVIRQLNSDLNDVKISGGVNIYTLKVYINAQRKKFSKAMEWLNNILFNVHFDEKRVSLKVNQLLTSKKKAKQSAGGRLFLIMNDLLMKNDTKTSVTSFLRQEKFLQDLKTKMENDAESVLNKLKEIYKKITALSKLSVHIQTNVEELDSVCDIESTLKSFASNSDTCLKDFRLNDLASWMGMKDFSENSGKAFIHGMDSVQSSYLRQVTTGVQSNTDCHLPALYAVITYFTQHEGPFWKGIRGNGLAYDSSINVDTGRGLLTFSLNRASHLTKAYEVAKEIISSHLNGSTKFEPHLLEAAKSSLIYLFASSESEIAGLSSVSMSSYYARVPYNYTREMIKKIRKVTMEDAKAIGQKYLRRLMDPHESLLVTVTPSNKVNETTEMLTRFKFNVEAVDDIEESRFA